MENSWNSNVACSAKLFTVMLIWLFSCTGLESDLHSHYHQNGWIGLEQLNHHSDNNKTFFEATCQKYSGFNLVHSNKEYSIIRPGAVTLSVLIDSNEAFCSWHMIFKSLSCRFGISTCEKFEIKHWLDNNEKLNICNEMEDQNKIGTNGLRNRSQLSYRMR